MDQGLGNPQPLCIPKREVLNFDIPVLVNFQPDWVLVQGDTTTVMAAAVLAYYHQIKVGHVEAGLRTGDKFQPFPEEINRRVAGVVADLHFAPTEWSRQNLLRENTPDEQIVVTGNPAIAEAINGHGLKATTPEGSFAVHPEAFVSLADIPASLATLRYAGVLQRIGLAYLLAGAVVGYGLLRYLSQGGNVRDELGDGLDAEVAFNYLGQFDQVMPADGRWRWSGASAGAGRNPRDKQTHLISINARIINGVLQVPTKEKGKQLYIQPEKPEDR